MLRGQPSEGIEGLEGVLNSRSSVSVTLGPGETFTVIKYLWIILERCNLPFIIFLRKANSCKLLPLFFFFFFLLYLVHNSLPVYLEFPVVGNRYMAVTSLPLFPPSFLFSAPSSFCVPLCPFSSKSNSENNILWNLDSLYLWFMLERQGCIAIML